MKQLTTLLAAFAASSLVFSPLLAMADPGLAMSGDCAVERLWPDATPLSNGWYRVEWYGYVSSHGDWIYHAEHGWQYALGDGSGSLYAYDVNMGVWAWTSQEIYPVMYYYWPIESWALLGRPAAPGQRRFYHFQRNEWRHETNLGDPVFVAGESRMIAVDVPSGDEAVIIHDALSGHGFSVPAGTSGAISVAPLKVHYPAPPLEGEGWRIVPEGLNDVELVLEGDGDGSIPPLVYVYADMEGAFSDAVGYGQKRWVALYPQEREGGLFAYEIPIPFAEVEGVMQMSVAADVPFDDQDTSVPIDYWISRIDADSPEYRQLMFVRLQVQDYLDLFLAELDSDLRSAVESRRDERRLQAVFGGDYYTGFNRLRLGGLGRRFSPVIAVMAADDTRALPHEAGHYMTHLLVGHPVYAQLERTGGSIFAGQHGIRDPIGRNNLLEDYAYYLESFLIGTGGNYHLDNPRMTFRDLASTAYDLPGLEGFAASMLALLHYEEDTIRDAFNVLWPISPLKLSWGEGFSIVASGRTSVNDLRQEIKQRLSPERRNAFQVLLHRLGWQYRLKGRLVDSEGDPLEGVEVQSVVEVDGEPYFGHGVERLSDEDGRFTFLTGFGGNSLLRVFTGGERGYTDFPVTVDWTQDTTETVDLGDIVIDDIERKILQDWAQWTLSGSTNPDYMWPVGFTTTLSGSIKLIVTHPDAALSTMRVDRIDETSPLTLLWIVEVPRGATVEGIGRFEIKPNVKEGITGGGFDNESRWRYIHEMHWNRPWTLWPHGRTGIVSYNDTFSDTHLQFNFEQGGIHFYTNIVEIHLHVDGKFEFWSDLRDGWHWGGTRARNPTMVRLIINQTP